MVERNIKQAPSSFTLYSRNPAKKLVINTENTCYVGPGGSSYVMDLDQGRRPSSKEDFIKLIKLFQMLEHIDIHSVPCELNDVDVKIRHLVAAYLTMKYSDKPFMGIVLSYEEAKEVLEMVSMFHGGIEAIKDKPVTLAIPCTITPLSYDDKALGTLMAFAEHGQPQLINSLCMAGATAPATIAGTIAVQNAEILAGIVLAQLVNPGTPVVYSAPGSNTEMRTGSLTIGSPEAALISLINGQLAKYYNIPCRISGSISDSKCVDAQAGYESMMNLMTAQMAGGNFILHGCGILETYNCVSFEKVIIDHEMLGMVKRIGRGIAIDEEALAFDVIKEVGPQGQFLTHEHTFSHFRSEYYQPTISDRNNFQTWIENGSLPVDQRANRRWKEILDQYDEPALPKDIDNALQDYINSRK